MVNVQKTLPQDLDDNSKYLVRIRSLNNFGVASDWSDSIIVNTETTASRAGSRLVITDNSIFGYDAEGSLTFAYFGEDTIRTNLAENPSFEIDTIGYISLPFTSIAISTEQSRFGTHSLKVTPTVTASAIGFKHDATGAFTVTPGELYTSSMYIFNPTANTDFLIRIGLEFFNSTVASLGTIWNAQNTQIDPDGEWFRITDIGVEAPPDSITARLKFESVTPVAITESFYLDAILIEESPVLREYFDGDTVSESGSAWTGTAHNSPSEITSDIGDVFIGGSLTIGGSAGDKITSFFQSSPPIALNIGDIWVDTDDNNKMYRWDGFSWVLVLDAVLTGGAADDVNGGVTTISGGHITTGTITALQIAAGTITGNKISANTTLTVGSGSPLIELIGTGTPSTTFIHSTNETAYATGSGFWMDASGRFSLGTALTWNGSALVINGSGTFSGALSAATGTFSGSLSAASGTFTGTVSAGTVTGSTITGGTISGTTITGGTISIASGYFDVDSSGFLTLKTDGFGSRFRVVNALDSSDYLDIISQNHSVNFRFNNSGGYLGIFGYDVTAVDGFYLASQLGARSFHINGLWTYYNNPQILIGASRGWSTSQIIVNSNDGGVGTNSAMISLRAQGNVTGYAPIIDCYENNGIEAVRIINNANSGHARIQASSFTVMPSSEKEKIDIEYATAILDKIKDIKPRKYRTKVRPPVLRIQSRFKDINDRWIASGHEPLIPKNSHYDSVEHDCDIDGCGGTKQNPCAIQLNDSAMYGLIAEEVYQTLPELVHLDADKNPAGLDIGQIASVAFAAVKELAAEVEILKAQLKKLKP